MSSKSAELITMIGNLSRSLYAVQHLLTGFAYMLGIVFIMTALAKLKKIGEAAGHSQESTFVPIAFFLGGAALLFLPSTWTALANTTFGQGNILQYTNYNPYDLYSSMTLVIQTAGVIWFIRGCVLLVHASEPDGKHGTKGFIFVCAGVLAMNFQNTGSAITAVINYIMTLTGFKAKG